MTPLTVVNAFLCGVNATFAYAASGPNWWVHGVIAALCGSTVAIDLFAEPRAQSRSRVELDWTERQ